MSEIIVYRQEEVLKYCQRKVCCDCPTTIERNIKRCNYPSIFVAFLWYGYVKVFIDDIYITSTIYLVSKYTFLISSALLSPQKLWRESSNINKNDLLVFQLFSSWYEEQDTKNTRIKCHRKKTNCKETFTLKFDDIRKLARINGLYFAWVETVSRSTV